MFIGIIGAVVEYDRKQQETGTDAGFFGKMYFWIEYETGKTDETAFATIRRWRKGHLQVTVSLITDILYSRL